ncbi:MAG: ABC transporter permease subunit [Lentisphaeria bacterium]|nr:ABC transporter permease subunit [Lentisphaeria bacterium]
MVSALVFTLSAADAVKRFTVGFDANFPPYGYVENGEYRGFDLDLAREVAKRNNWQIVLKPINWDAKDSELNSGMIDCIWNGFTINGRENSYTWSDPYVVNEQVVIVKDDSPLRKLADLKGKKVAVQTDTPVQKALKKGGERYDLGRTLSELVVVPDYNNAVMMLEAGSVDAIAMDIGVAKEKSKKGGLLILDEIVMSENYGIGFRKGDTKLRDIVQNTLLEMIDDGTAARISARYFDGKNVVALGRIKSAVSEDANVSGAGFWDNAGVVTLELLKGLLVSMAIFFLTLLFALPLGLLVACFRMSGNFLLRNFFRIFISVMRGTPLMLQLLVWFFGPYYLFGIQLSKLSLFGIDYRFIAVIIGFSLNYAAYFAEIYRAGISSIPRGQYEAACVLGYTRSQTFFRIVLPQVVKRILPPVTNEVITLVKDTSLAFSLAVLEMFTIAKQIASASSTMLPFIIAGVFYYLFNFIVAGVMSAIEKKLNYYR